jgi:hypothetical protein
MRSANCARRWTPSSRCATRCCATRPRIARRIEELKRRNRQFGFADMLARLKAALEGPNGEALRKRIVDQYPVALVDEFQDTSPSQYRIFDLLYRVEDNDPAHGLFLIGDPKQSIYGFRGADIHSYLDARRATAGRHYQLGTNFRSAEKVVAAVNRMFLHAEGETAGQGYAAGAFRFRKGADNPLPFEPVGAAGRKERLVGVDGPLQALAVNAGPRTFPNKKAYLSFFAHHCAEHIVRLLDDARAGFERAGRRVPPPGAGRHRRAGARPQRSGGGAARAGAARGAQRVPVGQGFRHRQQRSGRRAALAEGGRQPARRRPGARGLRHRHLRAAAGRTGAPGQRRTGLGRARRAAQVPAPGLAAPGRAGDAAPLHPRTGPAGQAAAYRGRRA